MDTRCYQKILSVFERQFIFIHNRMYVHAQHQRCDGNNFCFLMQMPRAAAMTLANK